jgi:hypothetical protein
VFASLQKEHVFAVGVSFLVVLDTEEHGRVSLFVGYALLVTTTLSIVCLSLAKIISTRVVASVHQ